MIIIAVFSACGQHELLKAKIFERKELPGNRLMIRYQYTVGEKTYKDSATVPNLVIKSDSIRIIIDPSKPFKSIPDLTR